MEMIVIMRELFADAKRKSYDTPKMIFLAIESNDLMTASDDEKNWTGFY